MRCSTNVLTWKAVIEFDSNDQIKTFAVCFRPFTGYKTALAVKAKPFSHFRHKTTWQDEYKCEILSNSRLR